MLRLGVDIGGTKIEIVVLDDAGNERHRHHEPTPHGTYDDALQRLTGHVLEAESAVGDTCTVGVGAPGSVSPLTGRLRNAFATPYNEQALRSDLEKRLRREVRVANDANCFALSECVDGAARGAKLAFCAILGTGVGGGIAVDSRVLTGVNAFAGEWGHNPFPAPPRTPVPTCKCGRRGCIQAYLSGPGLAFDHAAVTGEQLAPEDIVKRAAEGNADCDATIVRYEGRLALVLGGIINLLDPDVIVLGGGLSQLDRLYRNIPRQWAAHTYLRPAATRLLPPVHGSSSGVRGAAWLWRE